MSARSAWWRGCAPSSTHIPGIRVFMVPAQDLRVGGRQSDSQYQFTLWSSDIEALQSLGAARCSTA